MTSENKPASWLDRETFRQIVAGTPLISIDLIVRNEHGQVLLGQRLNRPAQGYWFVPGGRVLKNESLQNAFSRLAQEELAMQLKIESAFFKGIYEHFYDDSIFGNMISTHYIVLGYEVFCSKLQAPLPCSQHENYCWYDEALIIHDPKVHPYTKQYFSLKGNIGHQK